MNDRISQIARRTRSELSFLKMNVEHFGEAQLELRVHTAATPVLREFRAAFSQNFNSCVTNTHDKIR